MSDLLGKVAIVSGGARGIGAGIARKLAQAGAEVFLFDRRLDAESDLLMADMRSSGAQVAAIATDVSSSSSVNEAVGQVEQRCGRIDILVNNAGICPFRDFFSITDEVWHDTLQVNLTGAFYLSRAAARVMKEHGGGTIVNVSTVSAHIATPHQVHYMASKGGLNSLTRGMAAALAPHGIRVNAVAPGGVRTAINANIEEQRAAWEKSGVPARGDRWRPIDRDGTPDDIANGVLYLVSDAASYVTGICLPVDGGVSLV